MEADFFSALGGVHEEDFVVALGADHAHADAAVLEGDEGVLVVLGDGGAGLEDGLHHVVGGGGGSDGGEVGSDLGSSGTDGMATGARERGAAEDVFAAIGVAEFDDVGGEGGGVFGEQGGGEGGAGCGGGGEEGGEVGGELAGAAVEGGDAGFGFGVEGEAGESLGEDLRSLAMGENGLDEGDGVFFTGRRGEEGEGGVDALIEIGGDESFRGCVAGGEVLLR